MFVSYLCSSFTKFDWEFWTAAMFDDVSDWETWVNFLFKFANETPNRVPLSDWYDTIAGTQTGFQVRRQMSDFLYLGKNGCWRNLGKNGQSAIQIFILTFCCSLQIYQAKSYVLSFAQEEQTPIL